MKDKEKADRIINAVAVIAAAVFLLGAMVAIWAGVTGVKILLSAVVLLIGDYAVWVWTGAREKRERKERGRKK